MDRSRNNKERSARAANAGRRRKRRAGRRGAFRVAVLLFFLSAGVVLCLTVFFKIESVYVVGTDRYDPVEMAETSGVIVGSNLFRISKDEIISNLTEKYPYVESVEVSRKLPPAIEITITQCVPEGAVKEEGGDYVLITRAGKILERGIMYIPEDILLISGLDTTGVQPGEYLGVSKKMDKPEGETDEGKKLREEADKSNAERAARVKESLGMLEYLFKAMEESGFTNITNVDISDRLNMKINYENRLIIELGSEADLSYKMVFVMDVISKIESEARGTVYAADAAQKSRVSFRPSEGYTREFTNDEDILTDDEE